MKIKEVLATINQMQAAGIIDRYAIGGAVGATFYLEPIATLDVDIFVAFRPEPGKLLASPQPLIDYLTDRGCRMEGEYIIIADWPVQFLPPPTPLVDEALADAESFDVEGVPTRVCSAEHLACIALETGRPKDKARLLQFIEAGVLDPARMEAILVRHRLTDRWKRFDEQFLRGEP
ncbi:MAG: hypothetical protein ABI614_08595 [Planctomycetota bacterium]